MDLRRSWLKTEDRLRCDGPLRLFVRRQHSANVKSTAPRAGRRRRFDCPFAGRDRGCHAIFRSLILLLQLTANRLEVHQGRPADRLQADFLQVLGVVNQELAVLIGIDELSITVTEQK